jgi:4-aminobutyrate aminotransferase-like enzyme
MKYREGYAPLLPKTYCIKPDLKAIERRLKTKEIAGVILEPILGEGGYTVLPAKFIRGVRKLCSKYGTLLIVDEIQSGLGRTGKWFAIEHAGVRPDILCMAKGIASGFPLGAIAASASLMKKWSPGSHGGTFGGNPVCCAAACATLDVIRKKKLMQNSLKNGKYLKAALQKLQAKYPLIKDVRGMGLMIGVDFKDPDIVKQVMNTCLKNKLVIIPTGGGSTVIRLIPPLTVKKKEIDQALNIFEKSLQHAGI